jgi:Protein of unknown function (DUF2804)
VPYSPEDPLAALPYRGVYGVPRPDSLAGLPLPPESMPSHHRGRPLKAWRYIGVFGPEVMLCLGQVRVARARQSFWAVWERSEGRLHERTTLGRGGVELSPGRALVVAGEIRLQLRLGEEPGIETVCASGTSYAWTRKQGGIHADGTLELAGRRRAIEARAVIDDTAAYYPRHTSWRWSAGVGHDTDGRELAWNLVDGVNDRPTASERTVWIDHDPREVGPCDFADGLLAVDALRFTAEATRERRDNLILLRSVYRQPFGSFSGELPGGVALADGYGVMEEHEAWW